MRAKVRLPGQLVLAVKNTPARAVEARDAASVPGSGRSPGGGHATDFSN